MEDNFEKDIKCMEIDKKLEYKMLPPQVFVKNFIKNERDCNYENYLIELINLSDYFRNLSYGEGYSKPHSEENGQLDAISEVYSIDFKLLISKSIMEGKSILSDSITKYSDGIYGFGEPEARNKKEMKCTNICQSVRYLSLEELEKIENKKKRIFIEIDIANFLKVLRTQKNVLLFYPYEFSYAGEYIESEAIEELMKALYHDLKKSILYREGKVKGFDTYIATIFINKFIIFKIESCRYELVDIIATSKVPTFKNLISISAF